jgi:tight adherence protein C
METSTIIALIAASATALAIGAFVFVLFPSRKPIVEPEGDVHPAVGPVQQSSIGARLAAAAPRGYIGWIEKQIVLAGRPVGWSVTGIMTSKIVLAVVGVLFGFMVVALADFALKVPLAVVTPVLLFFLPDVRINSRAHDRQAAMQLALPDSLDQMTIAVEAGLGFDAAMAKSARNSTGPLAEEFIRTLQDMSIGRTRRDAFTELERRTNSEDLRRFARAIIQADSYGISIGEVLRVQAAEMRVKRRQRAEEQAMKVAVKMVFPLIFCFLPVIFIVVLTPAIIRVVETFSQ